MAREAKLKIDIDTTDIPAMLDQVGIASSQINNFYINITQASQKSSKARAENEEKLAKESLKSQRDILRAQIRTNKARSKDSEGYYEKQEELEKELAEVTGKLRKKSASEIFSLQREITNRIKNEQERRSRFSIRSAAEFGENITTISRGAIDVLQSLYGTVERLSDASLEFAKNTSSVQFGLKITEDSAKSLNAEVSALSKTFSVSFDEVVSAASVLRNEYEETGLTGEKSLSLVSSLLEKIPNAGAKGLEQIIEYSTQLRSAGFAAEESIAIIAQSIQSGIYSDKGVDAIKEARIRLQELKQPAKDALDAVSISSADLQSNIESGVISYQDAIQLISRRLNEIGVESSDAGAVIREVFGTAGEDAGTRFISSLENVSFQLDKVENRTSEYQQTQLEVNRLYEDTANSIIESLSPSLQNLAESFINNENRTKGFADAIGAVLTALLALTRGTVDAIAGLGELGRDIGSLAAKIRSALGPDLADALEPTFIKFQKYFDEAGVSLDDFAARVEKGESIAGIFEEIGLAADKNASSIKKNELSIIDLNKTLDDFLDNRDALLALQESGLSGTNREIELVESLKKSNQDLFSSVVKLYNAGLLTRESFSGIIEVYEQTEKQSKDLLEAIDNLQKEASKSIEVPIKIDFEAPDELTGITSIQSELENFEKELADIKLLDEDDFQDSVDKILSSQKDFISEFGSIDEQIELSYDKRLALLDNFLENGTISQERYNSELIELNKVTQKDLLDAEKEKAEESVRIANRENELKKESFLEFVEVASDLFGQVSEINNLLAEDDEIKFQERQDREKEKLKENLDNKLISQEEYDSEIAKLEKADEKRKKDARKRQKKADLATSLINTAVAVTEALPNLILAGLVGGLGLTQSAIIAKQAFKNGGDPVRGSNGANVGKVYNIGGNRHSSGGTDFYGTDGTEFNAELGEKVFIMNRGASAAYDAISDLNSSYVGKEYQDGGLLSYNPVIQVAQPSFNPDFSPIISAVGSLNRGKSQTISVPVYLDGEQIANSINTINNNSVTSGAIITENT